MANSMTGFGRGESNDELGRCIVEVRTVNHRFREIMVRMPRELSLLEEQLRGMAQECISRGRVDMHVTLERSSTGQRRLLVDKELGLEYHKNLRELAKALGIGMEITPEALLHMEGVFLLTEERQDAEAFWPLLQAATDRALAELVLMRANEGANLARSMQEGLLRLRGLVNQLAARAPVLPELYRQRLLGRLAELADTGQLDAERLMAEVALYAERVAVDEEIVRLRSHLKQLQETLAGESPLGRKCEFLLQEVWREINTLGSKAIDLVISNLVVEAKSEVEKLREQAQNLE
ncbi:MAG TPA: YicC family protein [Firmicutes bacterium]|jgi:uncharacterized protein (TIGR00255 family)|nr:YicC family protein [Bacillota bacterium]